jgi:uncharacterized membrane protein YfcA
MEEFIAHAPVLIPLLIVLGLVAGFMAGLLGIGGGIILVPGLFFLFKTLGYPADILMHLAVGTSLAIIIPTGISSARAHYKRGAVKTDLLRHIGPGIVMGVAAGTFTADSLSGHQLTVVFAVALIFFAGLMQVPPKVREDGSHTIGMGKGTIGGFFVGILSSLMGIGGATLNVPFMTLNGIGIHNAVATASALGPFIALPGTLGFIIIGWGQEGLPPFSLGYINLLAAVLIAPLSVIAAPYGAAAAHKVSVITLRRIFSLFIVIVALKMMWEAFHG